MKDLSRQVTMLCPVCGNAQFESLDKRFEDLSDAPDEVRLRCSDCGSVFTKEELLRENAEQIDLAVGAIIKDAKGEIEKELEKKVEKKLKKALTKGK